MAFNLAVIFFGSYFALFFLCWMFDLGKGVEERRGISIRWLFFVIAGIITGLVYTIYG